MKNILSCVCASNFANVAPTILRVVVGLIFAMHGWQKLTMMGVAGTAGFLGNLGFPMPDVFAVILIAAELGGGVLLILGLFTHWIAKILSVVAAVALFSVHASKGFFASGGGYEFILLILAVSVALVLMGPGRWSLDAAFKKAPTA